MTLRTIAIDKKQDIRISSSILKQQRCGQTGPGTLNLGQASFVQKNVGNQAFNCYLQTKLKVNKPGDKYEKEADRVADQIVNSDINSSYGIQRKCSSCSSDVGTCAGCEEEEIHRKEKSVEPSQIEQHPGLFNRGVSLTTGERQFYEPRFGRDFGGVKVHTDSTANKSAEMLNARAFTLGNNIAFGRGEYSPHTLEGKKLIAHELTHVVQQRRTNNFIQRKDDVRGTSKFREKVIIGPKENSPNIWSGSVKREEYVPKTKEKKEKIIHSGIVDLEFDSKNCEVRIPHKFKFVKPSKKNFKKCTDDQKAKEYAKPSDETFNNVKKRFLDLSKKWLNNWYVARIEGCDVGCANKDIPINIDIIESDSDPDSNVVITPTKGRSCVSSSSAIVTSGNETTYDEESVITLNKGDKISDFTLVHEAAHAVLEHGDEYEEEGRPLERVRENDRSLLAKKGEGGLKNSLLHKRHFQFVPSFLGSIYKDCKVKLKKGSTPFIVSYNPNFGISFGSYYKQPSMFISLGTDFGFSLDRLKMWEATIGLNTNFLMTLDSPILLSFFTGAKAAISFRPSSWETGPRVSAFGEFGVGSFQAPEQTGYHIGTRKPQFESRKGLLPYSQFGLNLGYDITPSPSFFIGAKGTYGQTIGRLDFKDAKVIRWFNLGFNMGLRF